MSTLLIIRFSVLGDVAMTLPVIWSLAESFPDLEIHVVSRKNYRPLFLNLPRNVNFHGADLTGRHKGLWGLHRFYTEEIRPLGITRLADLHWVLRSIPFYIRYKLQGVAVAHIDKGKRGKRLLTRRTYKVREPQMASYERYQQVFRKLGFKFPLSFISIFGKGKGDLGRISGFISPKGSEKWIGIAPFAKHRGKIFPLDRMQKVMEYFAGMEEAKVFLFGAGHEECQILEAWKGINPGSIYVTAGCFEMDTELILMSHLDVMISMDSANMHLASLVNVPVVSVWGATHPYAGFLGYRQKPDNCVQIELDCRPCSVFGNKPCYRRDYACMNELPFELIIRQAASIIHLKERI